MIFGKHFTKYYFDYLPLFLLGIAILIMINWLQLSIPEKLGQIVDMFGRASSEGPKLREEINFIIFDIAITAITLTIGRFLWRFAIFGTSRQIEYAIRKTMFSHATNLPISFYKRKKVGGLMTHFINDLAAVREAFGPGTLTLVDGISLGAFTLYKMFSMNTSLTWIVLVPIFALVIVVFILNRSMRIRFRARQDSFEKMSDFTQESFSGITVIKAYVREYKELLFFKKRSSDFFDKNIRYLRQMVIMQIAVSVVSSLIILLILAIGGYIVASNAHAGFTGGGLFAYYEFYLSLMWPISAVTRFFYITSQAKASGKRISEFLEEERSVTDGPNAIAVSEIKGSIKIDHLTFTYPDGDKPALKDISFEIKQGEMIGILGRTGSGKSSLVDLLLRMYNVPEKMIYLDGYDIMSLKIKEIRNQIAYVPQDNFLFSDTITSNIGFSTNSADYQKVVEASKYADVYENIKDFTYGFDTVLGERGVTVSGGQKQRISIARALYKDANILILDDSVSAVDTKTEEAIISNLYKIRKDKTTILIAHRISTVRQMDKIVVLDGGQVVAVGSHEELLNTSNIYADMVRRQHLEDIVVG